MNYYMLCECGYKLRVEASQAGSTAPCICGRTNSVPRLSKLLKEEAPIFERSAPPEHLVIAPAGFLIAVSGICLVSLLVSLAFSASLLVHSVERSSDGPPGRFEPGDMIFIRIMWESIMLISNGVIMYGALQMKRLRNYGLAKTAAVLAMIPCVGPCFVLGIPFGMIALSALNREDVKRAFDS